MVSPFDSVPGTFRSPRAELWKKHEAQGNGPITGPALVDHAPKTWGNLKGLLPGQSYITFKLRAQSVKHN